MVDQINKADGESRLHLALLQMSLESLGSGEDFGASRQRNKGQSRANKNLQDSFGYFVDQGIFKSLPRELGSKELNNLSPQNLDKKTNPLEVISLFGTNVKLRERINPMVES
ncbi:MAG: hypothetical protein QNL04_00715 [SAR324 cluster bacterium]|nr:hypothetical protein [SAR324 cluster bacterium]